MSLPNLGAMRAVAARLDPLGIRYAFVGGSIVNLLIDDPDLGPARPTDDVDVIVELAANQRYSELESVLRSAGLSHDVRQGAPICRWMLGGVTIDIMPTEGAGMGLNTECFAESLATAERRNYAHDRFSLISPVAFLATKYVAFLDRGKEDLYGSKDLEDFMTVIDGRAEIADEVDRAPPSLRTVVVKAIRGLAARKDLMEVLAGHLPSNEQDRLPLLAEKLARIAKLA